MADKQPTPQELEYAKRLAEARKDLKSEKKKRANKNADAPKQEKKGLLSRLGSGRISRYGKAAMLTAGMLHPSGPSGASAFSSEAQRDEADMNPEQEMTETLRGETDDAETQTPVSEMSLDDFLQKEEQRKINQQQQAAQNQQTQQAEEQSVQNQQAAQQQEAEQQDQEEQSDQEQQPQDQQTQDQQGGQSKDPSKAAEHLATAGQVGGRTVQGVSKGVEMTAKGTEMLSKGVKQGGEKLTQVGAELSSTGLGAIAGVPMMAAGGAMTVGGAVGESASKGIEKGAQASGKMGQRVAETSKTAKQGIKEGKSMGLGANLGKGKDSTGMPYMDLARKLKEEKRKAMQGDVVGIVDDAANEAGKLLTARALSWAWLTVIPTCGLSLIYINFHFVARYIAHSEKFCDFGEEWALKKISGAAGEGAKPLEEASAMLEKGEILGMVALDILIIGFFVILKIILDLGACLASHPVDTVIDPSSCYTNPTQ